MKAPLLVLALSLTALADEPVLRVQSIQPVDPKAQTQLLQQRAGENQSYPVTVNATGYVQDHFRTSINTLAALEFLIGGRVGINQNSDVEVVNERSVVDQQLGKRLVLKSGGVWIKADARSLKQPLEIQTNGGIMGIRGTEITVHEEEDGTVEVNCFESNSQLGGVEIHDLNGALVGTARPGDQYRIHRQRKPIFKRFQNVSQYRSQILEGPRFRVLGRHPYFAQRFLGGLGPMPKAELAHPYWYAQHHRSLERNPFARYGRTNPNHPGRRPHRGPSFVSMTFPSRLIPDSTDPGQRPVSHHPRFSWLGVQGADGYLVTVSRDEEGLENVFTRRVKSTNAAYPQFMRPLTTGRYYWRVTPLNARDLPILEASQTTFEVQ
ncbi:FecR domain-containing protein [bacterium]|nr:FecR domain-containing protein [bacterium]